jgi:hypothetical protein
MKLMLQVCARRSFECKIDPLTPFWTLQLASQHAAIFEKLLEAYRDIALALPRFDMLYATFGESEDFKQSLRLVYADILEFHKKAYKIFRRPGMGLLLLLWVLLIMVLEAWHLMFSVNWGLFERRFQTILSNLSRHSDNVDRDAAALHFQQMKGLRERS